MGSAYISTEERRDMLAGELPKEYIDSFREERLAAAEKARVWVAENYGYEALLSTFERRDYKKTAQVAESFPMKWEIDTPFGRFSADLLALKTACAPKDSGYGKFVIKYCVCHQEDSSHWAQVKIETASTVEYVDEVIIEAARLMDLELVEMARERYHSWAKAQEAKAKKPEGEKKAKKKD